MEAIKEYFIKSVIVNGKGYRLMRLGRGMTKPCRLYVNGKFVLDGSESELNKFIKSGRLDHAAAVLEE